MILLHGRKKLYLTHREWPSHQVNWNWMYARAYGLEHYEIEFYDRKATWVSTGVTSKDILLAALCGAERLFKK